MTSGVTTVGVDVQWATNAATGIGKCSIGWVSRLVQLDSSRKYVLFGLWGADLPNELRDVVIHCTNVDYVRVGKVKHRWLRRFSVVLREQWLLPRAASLHKCGLLFYPYFNVSVLKVEQSLVTITDLDTLLHARSYTLPQRLYYNSLLRIAASRGRAFLAISEATKRDAVRHLRIPRERIHVVYPGVGEHFRPLPAAQARDWCRSRYGLDGPFILYAGGVSVRKNIPRMLNAVAKARRRLGGGIRFALTGNAGRDPRTAELARTGPAPEVVWLGRVSEVDLPYLYSGAELVLYPSLYEGFGMPIVEAQACGAPVITSHVSSMPEVAGDAALLVDPTDEDAIADAIVRLLIDSELRGRLRDRGLNNARRYNWDSSARTLLSVIQEHAR